MTKIRVELNIDKYELVLGNKISVMARDIEAGIKDYIKSKYMVEIDIDPICYKSAVYINLNIQFTSNKDIEYTCCNTVSYKFDSDTAFYKYLKGIDIPHSITIELPMPKAFDKMFR